MQLFQDKIREALHLRVLNPQLCIDRFYSFYLTQAIADFLFFFQVHMWQIALCLDFPCLLREKKEMEKRGGSLNCEEKNHKRFPTSTPKQGNMTEFSTHGWVFFFSFPFVFF